MERSTLTDEPELERTAAVGTGVGKAPPHPSGAAGEPAALSPRDRAYTLAGVLIALLLAGIDHTIVATAGPEIQRDLAIPASLYAWLTTAYLITSTVMLPVYGKLSDLYGRKPILLVGVGLFLLGSLLSGLSSSTMPLIFARAVQGLGAASLFTSALAVIGDLYPPHERGKYMGLLSGVMGISSVIGPLVGGVITDLFGWHWAFFVNLPIGGVAIWLITTRMPRVGARPGRARIDYAGAATLVLGVVPLLVALSLLGRGGEGGGFGVDALGGSLLLASGVFMAAFVLVERRAAEPMVDPALFRNRVVALATAASFVQGAAFLFSIVFLPLYLVNVIGVSATGAGLALLPLTLGIVIGSVGSGQLVSRVGGHKRLLIGSLMLLTGAFAVLGFALDPSTTHLEITLMMLLAGVGFGPSFPLYTLAVQNAARPGELGVVTGAATFARSMGQVIGITVFGALFALGLGPERAVAASGMQDVDPVAMTAAIELLYRVGIGVVLLAILITAFMPDPSAARSRAASV